MAVFAKAMIELDTFHVKRCRRAGVVVLLAKSLVMSLHEGL